MRRVRCSVRDRRGNTGRVDNTTCQSGLTSADDQRLDRTCETPHSTRSSTASTHTDRDTDPLLAVKRIHTTATHKHSYCQVNHSGHVHDW